MTLAQAAAAIGSHAFCRFGNAEPVEVELRSVGPFLVWVRRVGEEHDEGVLVGDLHFERSGFEDEEPDL